eukprot:Em0001g1992a
MDNCSTNECNLSSLDEDQVSPTPYIVISVAHMLVVIVPTVSLGAIILYQVRADKEMRDPVTILFCAVTISSMMSPSVYGLLRDISMITDLPLLGSCLSVSRVVYTAIVYFLVILTPSQIALITCTQYLVIKYGKKRIKTRHVLTAFGVVTAMAAVVATLIIATGLGAYGEAVPKIRGSWCKENGAVLKNYTFQTGALAVVVVICPVTLIVVSSVRSYLIVKRSMMETDKIVRSVLLVCAASLILGFVFMLPTAVAYYISVAFNSIAISYFATSMSDTQYCFVLLLLMTTHRGIRNAVFSNVIKHFNNRNKVAP